MVVVKASTMVMLEAMLQKLHLPSLKYTNHRSVEPKLFDPSVQCADFVYEELVCMLVEL
jgi:hypothetical protein